MILAAHQPCFFPSVHFLAKLISANIFVLADDLKFTRQAQINRTKIKTVEGAKWLTVPVLTKHQKSQLIRDVRINNISNWQRKHLKTLHVNYIYASYFEKYMDYFENLYQKRFQILIDLNLEIIQFLCKELNITTKIVLSSEIKGSHEGGRKIIDYLTHLNCRTFLAEPQYKDYLTKIDFSKHGKNVKYFYFTDPVYYQQFGGFCPGLSVVDLLFNEGLESKNILTKYNSG